MARTTFTGPVVSDNGFIAGTGATVTAILKASSTIDFGAISGNSTTDSSDITVVGASTGDPVLVGAPSTINSGLVVTGYVSAADTVKIRIANVTQGSINPANGTFSIVVIRATA